MAVTIRNRVVRMTAAADTVAEQMVVGVLRIVGAAATGAFVVKDGAGNPVWEGDVVTAQESYQTEFPGGLNVVGLEFDTLPAGAVLYAYLL